VTWTRHRQEGNGKCSTRRNKLCDFIDERVVIKWIFKNRLRECELDRIQWMADNSDKSCLG
jgi:hypothetical protein